MKHRMGLKQFFNNNFTLYKTGFHDDSVILGVFATFYREHSLLSTVHIFFSKRR